MKMNMRNYVAYIFVFSLFLLFQAAKEVKAEPQKAVLSLDTSSIRIGERVQLRLQATLPKSATIYWPALTDTLSSAIEIASKSRLDTNVTSRKDFVNYSQNILITSFDTGFHYIPPFTVHYSYAGDTARYELLSEGIYLKVRTVDVDTTQAIRDIRGPMQAPLTFAEIAPYIGGVLILCLIIGLVWYYLWRKRMNKPLFPVITRVQGPPWQVALENLEALEKKKLWQAGKVKEYYSEITDILRQYLDQQHGIDAMEMITSEILNAYDVSGLQPDSRAILSGILIQADFVKFAKASPLKHENEQCMASACRFVESTKPNVTANETISTSAETIETPDTEVKA